ncbi:MAG: FixH family protein [Myxococcota bacterium]
MAERRDLAWPIGLACMLATMIAGSLAFFAIASANPDAEVVEDAYVAGLAFDEELALLRRAGDLGLSIGFETRPSAGGVHARVAVTDRDGLPVDVESVTLRRIRPTQGGYDADFALDPGDAAFEGSVPLPLPGRWRLEARLVVDGQDLLAHTDLWSS